MSDEQMQARDIYLTVLRHLALQGKPAIGPDGTMCMYRTEEGLKCAVGCLIPDEFYKKEMEGNIYHLFRFSSAFLKDYSFLISLRPHINLLKALQRVHDCPENWDNHKNGLVKGFELIGLMIGLNVRFERLQRILVCQDLLILPTF